MRRGPGEWAKVSALTSLVAFGALVTMSFALLLVHGLVWPDGIEDPTVFHQVAFLGLAAPFLAAPGVVVGWTVGARGRRLGVVALASALCGLGVELVSVASPVALWAGMVAGTLLGVVWVPRRDLLAADLPPGERGRAPGTSGGRSGQVGTGGGQAGQVGTGVAVRKPPVLLDPPQRRRVPRDVLAPPDGWEVPDALPPRPARCEVEIPADEIPADDADDRPSHERPAQPTGRRGERIGSL